MRPPPPEAVVAPHPARLAWIPVHVASITSLAIGATMAASASLGHEILHGAIVRDGEQRDWGVDCDVLRPEER